jgi:hypothetical protein
MIIYVSAVQPGSRLTLASGDRVLATGEMTQQKIKVKFVIPNGA